MVRNRCDQNAEHDRNGFTKFCRQDKGKKLSFVADFGKSNDAR